MKWKRTHTCGELTGKQKSQTAILMGWVDRRRDHGGLIFIDLRDRYGVTQIQINPASAAYEEAKKLRNEYVVAFKGIVEGRPEGMTNVKLKTGEIELIANEIEILNTSETPPIPISGDINASEDLRLKYRYLDLRRPDMQKNMFIRHKAAQIVRNYLDENKFLEIETPYLMKSTPEGARDFLVPSRVWKGKFYALPQSPQQYKQLLMVSGYDRYFQIVRCFRDEDLRADRQPEFTQIDMELSFIDEEDIFKIMEGLIARVMKEILGITIPSPIQRIPYKTAMEKYGIDRPDLRFGMEINNISSLVEHCEFNVFSQTVKAGHVVAGICVPGGGKFSRKQIDDLTSWTKEQGAKGLVAIKVKGDDWDSTLDKFFSDEQRKQIVKTCSAQDGDLLLFVADVKKVALPLLGDLRLKIAREQNMIPADTYKLAWVVDFPLFEYSAEEGRWVACHHPFTSPIPADEHKLLTDPEHVTARAYDLVLNGMEIAGGSIRIANAELQAQMFTALGISDQEAQSKFGFLMEAFKYGAPPHGGIAFGFDRMIMILAGCSSIRDVIAFPKTATASSLMDGSPSTVKSEQLLELGLRLYEGI
ncbi:MAG TPA: aspartate--tRNA ligase [bacterium]|nr:aspartate--tRNA ligase [bacterium]HPN42668.1 aspartate--tRNA ligase [bacterium]